MNASTTILLGNSATGETNTVTTGTVADNVTGGSGNDVINVGNGANYASGAGGSDSITGGTGADELDGAAGNDTLDGGAGIDNLTGGSGNDVFKFATSDVGVAETIDGGSGTDTVFVVTSTDFSTGTGLGATLRTEGSIEQVVITASQTATFAGSQLTGQVIAINENAVGTAGLAIAVGTAGGSFSFASLTFAAVSYGESSTGNAFDDGADTVTISWSGSSTATTVVGTSIADSITGGSGADTITGGAGADSLIGGSGADTYVFAATGALNGADVFAANIVGGVGGDILDFSAFLSGGSLLNATATESNGTADTAIAGKVVLLANAANGSVSAVDSISEIVALIQGANNALELASGGKAIIIAGDDSAATAGATIYFIDDTLDGTAGTISAGDVVIVGTATLDIDTVLTANLDFIP
jgi:Ca2+-binding RTX toxin-like protein